MSKHIGSDFDAFLNGEGMQEEVTAAALKRVIAWQMAKAMKAHGINKTEMAKRMHTSRMVVSRLLDENDTSVTGMRRRKAASDPPHGTEGCNPGRDRQ